MYEKARCHHIHSPSWVGIQEGAWVSLGPSLTGHLKRLPYLRKISPECAREQTHARPAQEDLYS